jgi:putative oxidoreductase
MNEEQGASGDAKLQGIAALVEKVSAALGTIATPSLMRLVRHCALAVPFWRSGVNKWDGFLQLNDVAVLLFSSEFKLHLPGGPYDFPAPGLEAFASGSAEVLLPILLVSAWRHDWRHSGCS